MRKFVKSWFVKPVNALGASFFSIWAVVGGIFLMLPFDSFLPAVKQLFPHSVFAYIGELTLGLILVSLGIFQLIGLIIYNLTMIRISAILFAAWFAFVIAGYLTTDWRITSFPTEVMAFFYSCFLYLNTALYQDNLRYKDNRGSI